VDASLRSIGLPLARHHLFLCPGPECCSSPEGSSSWLHLKLRLKELGIPALRTKAACLRVCGNGPILLIYPDGIWYERMTPERIDRVLQEHLIQGHPVAEWIIARHPLS